METLTPAAAAAAVARAQSYDAALRQRTEGLTMMVWGMATAGMFVTFAFASLLGARGPTFAWLWLPWVLLGGATTYALWRSAALSRPEPGGWNLARGAWCMVAASLAFGVAFAILRPDGPLVPLGVTGAGWTLMALAGLFRASARGRALWAAAGLVLAASALALQLAAAPIPVAGTASLVLPGALPALLGLWQSLRA